MTGGKEELSDSRNLLRKKPSKNYQKKPAKTTR
jgi:hypothetical protein